MASSPITPVKAAGEAEWKSDGPHVATPLQLGTISSPADASTTARLQQLLYEGLSDGIVAATSKRIHSLLFSPSKQQRDGAESITQQFDVSTFVAEGLELYSLQQLRDVLSSELEAKRAELAAAINENYASFVSLSTQLDSFDSALLKLSTPLEAAKQALFNAKEAVVHERHSTSALRRRVGLVKEFKNSLSNFSHAKTTFTASQAGIKQLIASDSGSEASVHDASVYGKFFRYANLCVSLQRIVFSAKQSVLRCLDDGEETTSAGSVLQHAQGLQHHIDALASAIETTAAALGAASVSFLEKSLKHHDKSRDAQLRQLLVAISFFHCTHEAEMALIRTLVSPYLSKHVTVAALDDGVRGSGRGIDKVMAAVALHLLGTPEEPSLLQSIATATSGIPGFDVVTRVIWTPVVAHVLGQPVEAFLAADSAKAAPATLAINAGNPLASQFFSAAHPHAFRGNFLGISSLFSRLRFAARQIVVVQQPTHNIISSPTASTPLSSTTAASTSTSVLSSSDSLLSSSASASLAAVYRPKLITYHGMRTAEISTRVEKSLESKLNAADFAAPHTLELDAVPPSGAAIIRVNVADIRKEFHLEGVSRLNVSSGWKLSTADQSALTWCVDGVGVLTMDSKSAEKRTAIDRSYYLFLGRVLPSFVSAAQSLLSINGYLAPLHAETCQYFLGMLSRLGVWVTHTALAAAHKLQWQDALIEAIQRSDELSIPSTWLSAAQKSAADVSATSELTHEALLALAHDVNEWQTMLFHVYLPRISACKGGDADELRAIFGAVIVAVLHSTNALRTVAKENLSRALCTNITSAVKAVPGAFRMGTARVMPTQASAYCSAVFRNVKTFIQAPHSSSPEAQLHALLPLSHPDTRSFLVSVGSAVFEAFGEAVGGVLASMNHMEASLQWLRKANTSSDLAAVNVSDSDRIGAQLLLDARAIWDSFEQLLAGADIRLDEDDVARDAFQRAVQRLKAYDTLTASA